MKGFLINIKELKKVQLMCQLEVLVDKKNKRKSLIKRKYTGEPPRYGAFTYGGGLRKGMLRGSTIMEDYCFSMQSLPKVFITYALERVGNVYRAWSSKHWGKAPEFYGLVNLNYLLKKPRKYWFNMGSTAKIGPTRVGEWWLFRKQGLYLDNIVEKQKLQVSAAFSRSSKRVLANFLGLYTSFDYLGVSSLKKKRKRLQRGDNIWFLWRVPRKKGIRIKQRMYLLTYRTKIFNTEKLFRRRRLFMKLYTAFSYQYYLPRKKIWKNLFSAVRRWRADKAIKVLHLVACRLVVFMLYYRTMKSAQQAAQYIIHGKMRLNNICFKYPHLRVTPGDHVHVPLKFLREWTHFHALRYSDFIKKRSKKYYRNKPFTYFWPKNAYRTVYAKEFYKMFSFGSQIPRFLEKCALTETYILVEYPTLRYYRGFVWRGLPDWLIAGVVQRYVSNFCFRCY